MSDFDLHYAFARTIVSVCAESDFTSLLRILIRPHPAIWRLVHGMAVIYLVALTFLLFQVV